MVRNIMESYQSMKVGMFYFSTGCPEPDDDDI